MDKRRRIILIAAGFGTSILVLSLLLAQWIGRAHPPIPGPIVEQPCRSIAESKSSQRFVCPVNITPRTISFEGTRIEFNEAWIEKVLRYEQSPLGYVYKKPTELYFLCLTLSQGSEPFYVTDGTREPFFVLDDEGKAFGTMYFTTPDSSLVFRADISDINEAKSRIYLLKSWKDTHDCYVDAEPVLTK